MAQVIDLTGRTGSVWDRESRVPNPRLMNLHAAAEYIGVSYWTMLDYVNDGIVPNVILPCSRRRKKGGAIVRRAGDVDARRKYVERAELDRLIEKCRRQAEQFNNN